MADVTVQILEDGEVVETKPLPPDEYMVLCGERREISHVQDYLTKGTVVVTIKRCASAREIVDHADALRETPAAVG